LAASALRSLSKKNGVSSAEGTRIWWAGSIPYPPRSPLTPCDSYLWGYVKEQVYHPSIPQSLRELISQVTVAAYMGGIRILCWRLQSNQWSTCRNLFWSCGICGGQSGTGALPILIPPDAPYSFLIRGWYSKPVSGRRTKWAQSLPTPQNLKKNLKVLRVFLLFSSCFMFASVTVSEVHCFLN
jgi:hypothetical protein